MQTLKLNREEKDFLDNISLLSTTDKNTTRKVLYGMLLAFALELYKTGGSDEIKKRKVHIPYLFSVIMSYEVQATKNGLEAVEKYSIETAPALHEITKAIANKDETFLKKMLEHDIREIIEKGLSLD